jgi:hypothetical protein
MPESDSQSGKQLGARLRAALTDEEGDYANHDEHWHPPYFDPYALAEDLDVVAVKLAPGLDRAFALADEPGLFDDALAEIDRGIASYPDSVQMNEDVCTLGPHATTCALRWIWLGLATKPAAGGLLVDRLLKLETDYEHVAWNQEAAVRFFGGLPEEERALANGVFAPPQPLEGHEDVRVPGVLRGVTPRRT